MTVKEFLKNKKEHTFLVITVDEGIFVEVYKTDQVFLENDLWLKVDGNTSLHSEGFNTEHHTEINEIFIKHDIHDDGHTHSIYLYDCLDWKSLKAAHEKIVEVRQKLENELKQVNVYDNFVYEEYREKRYKKNSI